MHEINFQLEGGPMANIDWKKIKQRAQDNETRHVKVELWTNRIVRIILALTLLLLLFGGFMAYRYVHKSLSPVDANNKNMVKVTIPIGSTADDIAKILEKEKITDNADIFKLFMKFKGSDEFQAGYYEFSPSMDADAIMAQLSKGGEPIHEDVDTTLTIIEGMQLTEIADMVAQNTSIKAEDFIKAADNQAFIKTLADKYPSMLSPLAEIEGLKHPLEGYLYPATYDYMVGMTAEDLIDKMVAKANLEFQKILPELDNSWMTYHQVLALASIIEREASTDEDRAMVAGVFMNRIDAGMPLQSDITVIYALGQHKELVTNKDTEVDSPYNTYLHEGIPVGPINSPSHSAIMAALYPTPNEYYYFVADMATGKIYYSSTIEEHDALVEKYVQPYFESAAQQGQTADTTVAETTLEEAPAQ